MSVMEKIMSRKVLNRRILMLNRITREVTQLKSDTMSGTEGGEEI